MLSELKIRCQYFERGCTQFVELGNLERHVSDCGFAPAVCSNEGCQLEVNKQDLLHHQTAVCEQRRVICHSCDDIRREMAVVNERLENNEKDLKCIEKKMVENQESLKRTGENAKALVEKVELVQKQLKKQEESNRLREATTKKRFDEITNLLERLLLQTSLVEDVKKGIAEAGRVDEEPKVIIAGGENKRGELNSVEMFSLSTRAWTPLEPMKERRSGASSVVYNNHFIVNGGKKKTSAEKLVLNAIQGGQSITWENVPAVLTVPLHGHRCAIHRGRLIVIGGFENSRHSKSITEITLDPPYTSKLLYTMRESSYLHGVAIFGDKIVIVGGLGDGRAVLEYDITKNVSREMAPVPYHVSNMAMIKWNDNFLIIGGSGRRSISNKVLMYNVKTEQSCMLPDMLKKKSGCVAAVVKDTSL